MKAFVWPIVGRKLWLGLLTAGLGMAAALAQTIDTVLSTGLLEPYSVAVDRNNYLIADSAQNVIIKLSSDTGITTNFVGFASAERGTNDGFGTFARFFKPRGLVVVPWETNLIVADTGNQRLRRAGLSGAENGKVETITIINPNAENRFLSPVGLALDNRTNETRLYVADEQTRSVYRVILTNRIEAIVTRLSTNFFRPRAVAVDDTGRVFVADTGNNCIKVITVGPSSNTVSIIAGSGTPEGFGFKDSPDGKQALFDSPVSLLWVGGNLGLLVGDERNHVLRRVSPTGLTDIDTGLPVYNVETYAPSIGAGFENPTGLARDASGGILVADLANTNVRRINATQTTQVPVNAPVIGEINLVISETFSGTRLTPVTDATFNNDIVVQMLTERGTTTYYTTGLTGSAEGVPDPTSDSPVVPSYVDGSSQLPSSLIRPIQPDVTVKAFSTQAGRRPSKIVASRFRFQVANPAIVGNNPASLKIECATTNALIYYTTDNTEPTTASRSYVQGTTLNLITAGSTNDVIFKVRAFKTGYADSGVVLRTFLFRDFSALEVTKLGFAREFEGAGGATLVLPIDVRLAGSDVLQSLQFRVEIEPVGAAPVIAQGPEVAQRLRLLSASPRDFIPLSLPGSNPNRVIPYTALSSSTGNLAAGLGIAYLGSNALSRVEVSGTVALLAVTLPTNAATGQKYLLRVRDASGTADGLEAAVKIDALTNVLTVGSRPYVVGDTAEAKWYNAEDPKVSFGDRSILNNDVNNAFYASLGVRIPFPFTDLYDALDAYPEDTTEAVGGDGQIRFMDWQVILRRSFGILGGNWARLWTNGVRVPLVANLSSSPLLPARELSAPSGPSPVWYRPVKFRAGTVENAKAGTAVQVPIYIELQPGVNWAGGQLWPVISQRSDGTESVVWTRFEVNSDLRLPAPSTNSIPGVAPENVVFVWDTGRINPPLTGSNLLGRLNFVVPPGALNGDHYVVRFHIADGATIQDEQLDAETVPGSVWVQARAPSPPARVSDEWKTNFFGSITTLDAQEGADPDGDGLSNLGEYVLNHHPRQADWQAAIQLRDGRPVIRWYGESNKTYQVLGVSKVPAAPTAWQPVSGPLSGLDQVQEFVDTPALAPSRYYRLQLLTP
jgi:hypothetical protein